ncbi:MAG: bifunctional hydroxymethylpyrimidine kinase/phosphomethylpyrimidine kinase, partial [Rhodospirillales bacterium]|nr:bifunctional hydroxymethylpyrimidine kinase/phosphomethylpyrimidine kinase [Rhodospirillales bacterium]
MGGRVLIIAGSDSGGGAGIQADIKAVTALGGYAMTAITALTAQNTQGVFAIHEVPPEFITQQIEVVLDDIGADAIKIGMLHRPEVIDAVADALEGKAPGIPLVLDPVMVAKGGHALLESRAVTALKERLIPMAAVLTPNLPEAEALTGLTVRDEAQMGQAAAALRALGAGSVLLKGGHLAGDALVDLLVTDEGTVRFEDVRIDTVHTHGTGCTTASAIAAGIAQGMNVPDAVARARAYVREAIRTAPGLGHGHGPLNHGHTVRDF